MTGGQAWPAASTLVTYLLVVSGFVLMPGPSVLLTLARSVGSGTRVGLMTALGIAAGDAVHTALAVFGISAILLASALAFSVMKYAGAGYLICLGIKAWRESGPALQVQRTGPVTGRQAFREGFLCEVANPKSALFFIAFLPQFVDAKRGQVALQLSIFGLLFVLLGTLATACFALVAGRASAALRNNQNFATWQGRVLGTLYFTLGARLALQQR